MRQEIPSADVSQARQIEHHLVRRPVHAESRVSMRIRDFRWPVDSLMATAFQGAKLRISDPYAGSASPLNEAPSRHCSAGPARS